MKAQADLPTTHRRWVKKHNTCFRQVDLNFSGQLFHASSYNTLGDHLKISDHRINRSVQMLPAKECYSQRMSSAETQGDHLAHRVGQSAVHFRKLWKQTHSALVWIGPLSSREKLVHLSGVCLPHVAVSLTRNLTLVHHRSPAVAFYSWNLKVQRMFTRKLNNHNGERNCLECCTEWYSNPVLKIGVLERTHSVTIMN